MAERTDEMDTSDLRSRVVHLEHSDASRDSRITALEQWRTATDLATARKDEQFTTIKNDITSIKGTMSRIMWLIVTAIIVAIMSVLLRGGIHIP